MYVYVLSICFNGILLVFVNVLRFNNNYYCWDWFFGSTILITDYAHFFFHRYSVFSFNIPGSLDQKTLLWISFFETAVQKYHFKNWNKLELFLELFVHIFGKLLIDIKHVKFWQSRHPRSWIKLRIPLTAFASWFIF